MKNTNYTDRERLMGRFTRLEIGYDESIEKLSDTELDNLVKELETAQRAGLLNVDTEVGYNTLVTISSRHLTR